MTKTKITNSLSAYLRAFAGLTVVALLAACVPMITTVYNGPLLSGQVLSMKDFTPIQGAQIYYVSAPDERVITDEHGLFSLPPPSETKALIVMPAHAIQKYKAVVEAEGHINKLILASGGMQMRHLEADDVGIILLDNNPGYIAEPTMKDGSPYRLIKTFIFPHSLFGNCDKGAADYALSELNTYRRLYWLLQDSTLENNEKLIEYNLGVKNDVADLWHYVLHSCNEGRPSLTQGKEIKRIFREVVE